eukprot:2909979-Rhodomonas_salina.1
MSTAGADTALCALAGGVLCGVRQSVPQRTWQVHLPSFFFRSFCVAMSGAETVRGIRPDVTYSRFSRFFCDCGAGKRQGQV